MALKRAMPVATQWFRFSSYEIVGGFIVPATSAEGDSYRLADSGVSHHDLLELATQLQWAPSRSTSRSEVEADRRRLVTTWCSKYGLLGLLPHTLRMLALPPTWETRKDDPDRRWLVKTQRRYVRRGATWEAIDEQVETPFILPRVGSGRNRREIPFSIEREGALVADQVMEDDYDLRPFVEVFEADSIDRKSMSWLADMYFPGIPRDGLSTHHYHAPLSAGFWREYAEPLDDFVREVTRLQRIIGQTIATNATRADGADLNDYLKDNCIFLGHTASEKRPQWSWEVPSLLAFMALSAARARVNGEIPRFCSACGSLFVTSAYQTAYCSSACKSRIHKRHFRDRKKSSLP